MTSKQAGLEGFIWWIATVENRNDPLQIGRLQVRIWNLHTQNKSLLPTSDLLWAYPIQGINSAAVYPPNTGQQAQGGGTTSSGGATGADPTNTAQYAGNGGIGISPTGILDGSTVFGFFADAGDMQIPIVFGTYAAMSGGKNDVSELARGHNSIKDNIFQTGGIVPVAEPKSSFQGKYPFNKVITTEKGHVIEVDDTQGACRIRIYHKSGTYVEISDQGRIVYKCVNNRFDITVQDSQVLIGGDNQVHIEGQWNEEIDRDFVITGEQNGTIIGTTHLLLQSSVQIDIQAPTINITGEQVNISGSDQVTIQGAQILENSGGGGGGSEQL